MLAAGASRRLGEPKQIVKHKGETLLARALRAAAEAGAVPVIVVLGAQAAAIRAEVDLGKAIEAWNPDWERGLATSIHAGLRALGVAAPEAGGVLVMTCDQPYLSAEHLRRLMAEFEACGSASIVASTYSGTRGTPAVFPCAAFEGLLALGGDRGARALLMSPPCPLLEVPFPGGEIDIDEPEDLRLLEG